MSEQSGLPPSGFEYQVQQVDDDLNPVELIGVCSSEPGAYSLASGLYVAKQAYAANVNFKLGIFDSNGPIAFMGLAPEDVV